MIENARLRFLITIMEPGDGAWSDDLRRAEAHYRLPQDGTLGPTRLNRLLTALMKDYESKFPELARDLRIASDGDLLRIIEDGEKLIGRDKSRAMLAAALRRQE